MGYTLKIGEARIDHDEDCVRINCDIVKRDDAPVHDDPTDYENQRWPSYSAWANSMKTLGLMDVMFNQRNGGKGEFEWKGVSRSPLLEDHPGAMPITIEHVEYVEDALRRYREKHPDHKACYPPPKPDAKPIPGLGLYRDCDISDDPRFDHYLCRGEWLAYWLRWAIDNCEKPVFVNS